MLNERASITGINHSKRKSEIKEWNAQKQEYFTTAETLYFFETWEIIPWIRLILFKLSLFETTK